MIFWTFSYQYYTIFPAEFLRRKIAFVIVFKYREAKKKEAQSLQRETTFQISEVNLKVEEIKVASIVASFDLMSCY